MRKLALTVTLLLSTTALATPAQGFLLSHEGRLLDSADHPVTGAQTLTFALSPNPAPPTSGADTYLWKATYLVNLDSQGDYAVMLGDTSNMPGTTTPNPPLTADILGAMASGPLYLEITVGTTVLSPRMELTPSPLAISALEANDSQTLQGHPASDFALASDTYTKEETDSALALKADAATTYSKSDIDTMMAGYYTKTDVDSALALKANVSDVYSKTDADAQFLAKTDAASTYLSQANAASTFLTQVNAASTYLSQVNAASTYLSQSNAASTYLTQANATSTYETQADLSQKLATEEGEIGTKVASVTAADKTLTQGGSATNPTFAVNTNSIQTRVTGTCPAGSAITAINADGTVTCTTIAPQRVVRWMTFNTYDSWNGWFAGNSATAQSLFGGVYPSYWSQNDYRANSMSNDVDTIRGLLTRKAYIPGPNAVIYAQVYGDWSTSADTRVTIALLRVKNSTASNINWQACFYFTATGGWAQWAGLALNGNEIWNSGGGNDGTNSQACPTLTLPANKISTVILSVTSSYPQSWGDFQERANFLAFYNNSLNLPSGLQFVDDLDYLPEGNLW